MVIIILIITLSTAVGERVESGEENAVSEPPPYTRSCLKADGLADHW